MTRRAATTICILAAGFALAGCAGDPELRPIYFEGAVTPISAGPATYAVGPVEEEGWVVQAVSQDGTADQEGARTAVLAAYPELCASERLVLSPHAQLFFPDGQRAWRFVASCPTDPV